MSSSTTRVEAASSASRRAPIEVRNEAVVRASAEQVWDILTDVERWPSWWRACRWVRIESSERGRPIVFRWKAHPVELLSTVVMSNRPNAFTITADGMGVHAERAFTLRATTDGLSTVIVSEETQVGPLPWFGRAFLGPRLRAVNQAMFNDLAAAVGR
jgi:carbon monoxide dehydrogenase subunit G